MLNPTLPKGLLALTAAGLLFTAATAQSGPNPQVSRDPFVNNNQGQTAPLDFQKQQQPEKGKQPFANPTVKANNKAVPLVESQPVVVEVTAPDVVVSGIVASPGGRQAILWTGSRSLIVQVGQQLADYRVKAIDANSVTFGAQGKSFKILLGQEG